MFVFATYSNVILNGKLDRLKGNYLSSLVHQKPISERKIEIIQSIATVRHSAYDNQIYARHLLLIQSPDNKKMQISN